MLNHAKYNIISIIIKQIFKKVMKFFKFTFFISLICILTTSCKFYEKVDQRQMPDGAKAKARKNVDEGKGVSLGNMLGKRKGGSFEFSSSNPLWRASLETLEFLPMTTVDYSGGMIITDWYSDDGREEQSIKITVRFLSNEISATSVKVIVHRKDCKSQNNCSVNVVENSKISQELHSVILRKAAKIDKESKKKKKN